MSLIGSLLTMLVVSFLLQTNSFGQKHIYNPEAAPVLSFLMYIFKLTSFLLQTLILPCACFLSILRRKVTRFQVCPQHILAMISRYLLICCCCCCCCSSLSFQVALCIIIIIVGVISSAFGTYSAIAKIIENLMH